jgi:hypothetical protein
VSHLTAAQRGNIETLLQEKYTNKDIAMRVGKDTSTMSSPRLLHHPVSDPSYSLFTEPGGVSRWVCM